jgi:hypothetical protein
LAHETLSPLAEKANRVYVSETTEIRRRTYGPLYWVPLPAGLLTIFYAGACFEGYWDTGKVALLAFAIFSSSLGTTLVTAGVRSYSVAAINGVFAGLHHANHTGAVCRNRAMGRANCSLSFRAVRGDTRHRNMYARIRNVM